MVWPGHRHETAPAPEPALPLQGRPLAPLPSKSLHRLSHHHSAVVPHKTRSGRCICTAGLHSSASWECLQLLRSVLAGKGHVTT